MENPTDKSTKKSFIVMIGAIVVIVFLIVILILELTNDDDIAVEPQQLNEDVVIQPTDEDAESVRIDVQPILETDDEASEKDSMVQPDMEMTDEAMLEDSAVTAEPVEESAMGAGETQAIMDSDEAERSYIVEEGDNLWKIAKKKDMLGDPFKWRTILIQNREKINYTIFSEETGQWKVMVDAGKRLVLKPTETGKVSTSFDRTRKKRYAVQLMSLNTDQLEKAVDIVKMLINDGYHAYLYRTRDKIKSPTSSKAQYYYRIRVGFYETEREALNVGEEITFQYEDQHLFPADYWAVLPSYAELNGELIDFGIQRNKPWIIQLAEHDSRSEAITDLKLLGSQADYSYISQKAKQEGGFRYRTRIGFYETADDANQALAKIQKETGDRFLYAEVIELRHVMEDAIGQSTGKSSLKDLR